MNEKNTTFLRNGFGRNGYANLGSCKSIVLKDKIFIVKIQHLLKDEKCIETFVTLNNACNPKWCLWMFRITCICIVFNKQLSFVTIVIKLRAAIKLVLKSPDLYLALHPPRHSYVRNTDNQEVELKLLFFSLQILCLGNLDEGYIFQSILLKLRSFLQWVLSIAHVLNVIYLQVNTCTLYIWIGDQTMFLSKL